MVIPMIRTGTKNLSVIHELGLGLDETLRKEARWNLEIDIYDQQIVAEIEADLNDPMYERYTKILDKFQCSPEFVVKE